MVLLYQNKENYRSLNYVKINDTISLRKWCQNTWFNEITAFEHW